MPKHTMIQVPFQHDSASVPRDNDQGITLKDDRDPLRFDPTGFGSHGEDIHVKPED